MDAIDEIVDAPPGWDMVGAGLTATGTMPWLLKVAPLDCERQRGGRDGGHERGATMSTQRLWAAGLRTEQGRRPRVVIHAFGSLSPGGPPETLFEMSAPGEGIECGIPGDGSFILAALEGGTRLFTPPPPLRAQVDQYLERAFHEIDIPTACEMNARGILILLYLGRALRESGREAPRRGGLAPWQLRRVTDFMIERVDRELSLGELAARVGLSSHHFCRAFKVSTGQPPHQWLTLQRIRRAQALMRETEMSLIEVALEVGYGSQGSFGAAFRRVTGDAPSEWRRRLAPGPYRTSSRRHAEGDTPVARRNAAAIALCEE